MAILAELQSIDRDTLAGPVRRLLGSDGAEVLDWTFQPLSGGFGNPVSLGLYRFAGRAQDRGAVRPWSLVLKAAQSPANVGAVDLGEGEDPAHWNYWKREMHVYRSDLLHDLPAGLAAPRCLGIEECSGDVIWLWIEEIADLYGGTWPLPRYGLAAYHFGRFNGAYLAGRPLPAYTWLSLGLLRQWYTSLHVVAPLFADLQRRPDIWEHPLVRRIYPPPADNLFLRFLIEKERFLAALDRLPQVVCHRDTYPTNLMARRRPDGQEETVAVDWALVGIGPVGEDLAQLSLGVLNNVAGVDPVQVGRSLFDSYLDGLQASGWRGDPRLARFGYAAASTLRVGFVPIWMINQAFERSAAAGQVDAEPAEVAAVVEQQAPAVRFVLEMAQEAYDLLDVLTGRSEDLV